MSRRDARCGAGSLPHSVVYLLGPPGVGKTTLMDALLAPYDRHPAVRPPGFGVFGYEPLWQRGREAGIHLGRTRADFSGTDTLAMNVLPDAAAWARTAVLPTRIYGEGARLAHPRFLLALHQRDGCHVHVLHLTGHPAVLDARCAARGSAQNAAWRRGSATRALNALILLAAAGVPHTQLDTTHLSPEAVHAAAIHAMEPLTP